MRFECPLPTNAGGAFPWKSSRLARERQAGYVGVTAVPVSGEALLRCGETRNGAAATPDGEDRRAEPTLPTPPFSYNDRGTEKIAVYNKTFAGLFPPHSGCNPRGMLGKRGTFVLILCGHIAVHENSEFPKWFKNGNLNSRENRHFGVVVQAPD